MEYAAQDRRALQARDQSRPAGMNYLSLRSNLWTPPPGVQVRMTNLISIRLQRTPDPGQPLPAFPARARPIPCKAIQQARDAARHRRQLPVDMAVTNYTWKRRGSGWHALHGPLPPHVGQTHLEPDQPASAPKPKSPELPGSDAQQNEEEALIDAGHAGKKKEPPPVVVRIGYTMKYQPRLQPRRWSTSSYVEQISDRDRTTCLLASSELAFKDSAPWLEMKQDGSVLEDLGAPMLGRDESSLHETSGDYEWIQPDFGPKHFHAVPFDRKRLTVKKVLDGAIEGPIDLRRDGCMEYQGSLDDLGNRTSVANFGVDRLVGRAQYNRGRSKSLLDMPLRLWAKESGLQVQDGLDEQDVGHAVKPEELWPVDDSGEPLPFWPPPKVKTFNRSDRVDVQESLQRIPDPQPKMVPQRITFEEHVAKVSQLPARAGAWASDVEKEKYVLEHMEDWKPKPGEALPHSKESRIEEETPTDLMSDSEEVQPQEEEEEEEETEKQNINFRHDVVYHPALPMTFQLSEERMPYKEDIKDVMITIDWWEHFEPVPEPALHPEQHHGMPQMVRQGAEKNLTEVYKEPVKRRARALIHTQTLLPGYRCDFLPEEMRGRKWNRPLSLIFEDELEYMHDEFCFNHRRYMEEEKELKQMMRHWCRMRRILESVVITDPETMRVHIVRYNMKCILQHHQMHGLEAALGRLEGGQGQFFDKTLPHIVARAMTIGNLLKPFDGIFPALRKDGPTKLKVPRVLVAAYLCNMFLCALPNNDFSFAELLCSEQGFQLTKLCCFLNYFRRLEQLPLDQPKGDITFVCSSARNQFNWIMARQTMTKLRVHTEGQVRFHPAVASQGCFQFDTCAFCRQCQRASSSEVELLNVALLCENVQTYDADLGTHLQVVPCYKNVGGGFLFRRTTPEETHLCNRPELSIAMVVAAPLGILCSIYVMTSWGPRQIASKLMGLP
jgi:hypothetical protein